MQNLPHPIDRLWAPRTPRPYTDVIDVRSPGEFAEDHIPGAVNLPVLTDAERAEVGTIYHQIGPFPARKIGAALVAQNIGRHLQGYLSDKDKDYRPLLYCWRGGHRSASMAHVLAQVGWYVTVLQGGYKTYRAHVLARLNDLPAGLTLRVLAGSTGTGKTRVLHRLIERGAQVLDLEGLARHRGSVLGEHAGDPQPPQKYFESLLLARLEAFDPAATVWVEAESNKIGNRYLPKALWNAMRQAGGVELHMPLAARVRYLIEDYRHLVERPEILLQKLDQLRSHHGHQQIDDWQQLVAAGKWDHLVGELLIKHYDPRYRMSFGRNFPNVTQSVELADSTLERMDALIDEIRD
ncbi:tRNA 2-selenouridine(34) synthase MnmH [Fimbriiglobus ruber]|uniref:Selenophosphate-dependent tRNA 2-selenouridine synthase n=1 Tax=Fimbriiglobus ruber TaxID=1908690 RepID=A0A225DIQ8_9BACT|nr:tRNA 2-selenouridine(34) synthase MnmH [Fimbriiglobus ruber]OWK38458.1 Selenophosphate-dependent tRNA 2-selenouridine synthase [Fimbriiglobus ruber]